MRGGRGDDGGSKSGVTGRETGRGWTEGGGNGVGIGLLV